ncbi:MAG TPA: hypothetical protein DCX03_04380 [Bacteroidales bacterium]|nr:hypothetical protein [Bacteroidales bacterium]
MNNSQLTQSLYKAYEDIFHYFNQNLFGGALPPVFLNMSRMNKAYGFYVRKNWGEINSLALLLPKKAKTHRTISEISINPLYTGTRTAKEYISTLVHEMCHHWQYEFGTPGKWGYHNKEFANKMRSIGLQAVNVKDGKETGFTVSHTIITNGAYSQLYDAMPKELQLPLECYELIASGDDNVEIKLKKARSKKSKSTYQCSGCGEQKIWGKPMLNVSCGLCGAIFTMIENEDGLHPDQTDPSLT